MSETTFKLGDRVTAEVAGGDRKRGTVVKYLGLDGSWLVYVDGWGTTQSFHRDELEPLVQPEAVRINTREQLEELAEHLGVREDWHEPSEQGLAAEVRGRNFDNAGSWGREDLAGKSHEELHVVLFREGDEVAMVNLATLLAFATGWEG